MAIGLYYPFIHFKDDDWLKISALYWDKMARIVPPTYEVAEDQVVLEGDSEVTRELAEKLEFVVNIPPNEVTYPVSELFEALLVRYAPQLRERYDVRNYEEWPIDRVTAKYAQQRIPQLAYVNSSKLHGALIQQLEAESLALGHWDGDEHSAGMHPRLAFLYMSALAEEVASHNGFHPTTDETLDHLAATGWSLPRLAAVLLDQPQLANEALLGEDEEHPGDPRSHEELRASLALVSLKAVVPVNADALSVDKVVEIRKEFGPELFRFQQFVNDVAEDLPQFGDQASPAAIAAHLQVAYDTQIEPQIGNLRTWLRGHGVDTMYAAWNTTIALPAGLVAISLANPVTFGAAAVLSLIPVLRAKRRQARQAYVQSPAAYLYRLQEKLEPRALLSRIGHDLGRFLVGI